MTTPAPTRVRPATTADLDTLTGFAQAMAWETEHKRLDPATVERGIAAVLARPARGRYLVAEIDATVVGALMLTYEWSDWRCGDWWWIQSVYVIEARRRHGVFRALYAQVRAEAEASDGVCGLRLYVENDNLRAQATYAALGMSDARYRVFEEGLPWLRDVIGKSALER